MSDDTADLGEQGIRKPESKGRGGELEVLISDRKVGSITSLQIKLWQKPVLHFQRCVAKSVIIYVKHMQGNSKVPPGFPTSAVR